MSVSLNKFITKDIEFRPNNTIFISIHKNFSLIKLKENFFLLFTKRMIRIVMPFNHFYRFLSVFVVFRVELQTISERGSTAQELGERDEPRSGERSEMSSLWGNHRLVNKFSDKIIDFLFLFFRYISRGRVVAITCTAVDVRLTSVTNVATN